MMPGKPMMESFEMNINEVHYIYIKTYIRTYIHTYCTYIHGPPFIKVYIHTFTFTSIYLGTTSETHTYIHLIHLYSTAAIVRTYMHIYIHTLKYTYIHTYIHTGTQRCQKDGGPLCAEVAEREKCYQR